MLERVHEHHERHRDSAEDGQHALSLAPSADPRARFRVLLCSMTWTAQIGRLGWACRPCRGRAGSCCARSQASRSLAVAVGSDQGLVADRSFGIGIGRCGSCAARGGLLGPPSRDQPRACRFPIGRPRAVVNNGSDGTLLVGERAAGGQVRPGGRLPRRGDYDPVRAISCAVLNPGLASRRDINPLRRERDLGNVSV
jgi:hypothetical protein